MEENFQGIKQLLEGFALIQTQIEAKIAVMQAQIELMDDDQIQPMVGDMGGGSREEDYSFKITATKDDATGLFDVNVLGGTAQTLGGAVHVFDDAEFANASEGDHVWLVYHNVDQNFVEIGTWEPSIQIGTKADMLAFIAPQELVFEIGKISSDYSRGVRQDHKGNVVMPAISNIVDIQTKLP